MTEQDSALPTSSNTGLDAKALDALDASIQGYIDEGKIYGASILVARGGVVGHRKLFGTVAPNRPAADDDQYLMMSLSKSFVAALILRAVDAGRFFLDTRVADILPEFAAGGKQRVTLRMLLTHTAGTFAGLIPPGLKPAEIGDLAKYYQAISGTPAANIPGERCVYNPAGSFAVLGQLLFATDPKKRSFRDIARQELFEPLGMHDTVYGLSQDAQRRVPTSYTPASAMPETPMAVATLTAAFGDGAEMPAASSFGTVDDVFRLAETWRMRGTSSNGYRLLSPALFDYARQIHTGNLSNGAWDSYREAHGLADYPANFSLLGGYVRGDGYFINGAGYTASPDTFYAVGGGSTMWLVDPERDLTFVFLSAGLLDGLAHFDRLRQHSDLVLAACND